MASNLSTTCTLGFGGSHQAQVWGLTLSASTPRKGFGGRRRITDALVLCWNIPPGGGSPAARWIQISPLPLRSLRRGLDKTTT